MNLLHALPLDSFNIPASGLMTAILQDAAQFAGQDLTRVVASHRNSGGQWRQEASCLADIVKVGEIDTRSVGCIASDVVLYMSLVVILGVILVKFVLAVAFGWCLSWKLGNFKEGQSYKERMRRDEEIENWTSEIHRPAEAIRPYYNNTTSRTRRKSIMPRTSRFTQPDPGSTHFGVNPIDRPVSTIWRNSHR